MKQNINKQCILIGGILLVILVIAILGRAVGNQEEDVPGDLETAAGTEGSTAEPETANGQAEEIQIVTPGSNPNIRVQICAGDYTAKFHDSIRLVCSSDYTVSYGDITEEHTAEEPVWFTPDDPWFASGKVTLTPNAEDGRFTLTELKRTQANPSYEGRFIVENTEQGILVVNELPLETYLCSVVPSEMPSTYSLEALKAQAVCARTYALQHVLAGKEENKSADLDDSVSFQVYNNIARSEMTDRAVKETEGQVLMQGDVLINALYFSTSCGVDLRADYSEEAVFCAFMTDTKQDNYEKDEPWYRWSTYYSLDELTRLAGESIKEPVGQVTGITVLKRDANGAVSQLQIDGEQGTAVLEGEYNIRKFLRTEQAEVTLQNGKKAPDLGMLPSAFFYLDPDKDDGLKGYGITGGGYGHGTGLSQNGANHMAEKGKTYEEILWYYYG